ncbi:hypothetical protein BKA63DRAFT_561926 [Paraphoma chrysanthemicola]|nr:hypothetical protein BKA63DRAFT_561926 [Paraphoma chrysanthemicola]
MTLVVKPRTSNNEVSLTLIGTEVTVGAVAGEVGVGVGALVVIGGADDGPGTLGEDGAGGEVTPADVGDGDGGSDGANEELALLEPGNLLDDGLRIPGVEVPKGTDTRELDEDCAGVELRKGSETVLAGALELSAADVERKEPLLRVGIVEPNVLKVGKVLLDTLALKELADTETLDEGWVLMPDGLALLIRVVSDDAEVEVCEIPDKLPIDDDVLLELEKLNVDEASDLVAVVLGDLEERPDEPVRPEDVLKLERLTKVEEALFDGWLIGVNEIVGSSERLRLDVKALGLVVVRTPDRVDEVWDVIRPLLEDDDILTGGIDVLNAMDELVADRLEARLLERKEEVSLRLVELPEVRLSDVEEGSGGASGIVLVDRIEEVDTGSGGTPSRAELELDGPDDGADETGPDELGSEDEDAGNGKDVVETSVTVVVRLEITDVIVLVIVD